MYINANITARKDSKIRSVVLERMVNYRNLVTAICSIVIIALCKDTHTLPVTARAAAEEVRLLIASNRDTSFECPKTEISKQTQIEIRQPCF